MKQVVLEGEKALEEVGLCGTPAVLNEWNYIKGWAGEDWLSSIDVWKSLKGASFIAGTMCACQDSPASMLMFYDARPCLMNSLFDTDRPWVPLKGYYPFKMFSELYSLSNAAAISNTDGPIYLAAASDGKKAAIMLTFFEDETDTKAMEVELTFKGLELGEKKALRLFLLDGENDLTNTYESPLKENFITLNVPLYTVVLITIE